MIRKVLLAGALAFGALALPATAHATTMAPLSQNQLVDASELIVRGTVTDIWTMLDDKGRVWTKAQVEVTAVLKGDPSTRTVVVSQLGGVHVNEYQLISGAARFSVGEDTLLYLETLGNGMTTCVGMWQGKSTVRIDPDSGREMAVRLVLSQDAWYDHRFLPHPPADERIYVDDLEAEIQGRVEQGWDGAPIPGVSPAELDRRSPALKGVSQ